MLSDKQSGLARLRVLDDVIESLLRYAVKVDSRFIRQEAVYVINATGKFDRVGVGDPFNEFFQRLREADLVQMIRPEIISNLPDFSDGLRGGAGNLLDLLFGSLSISEQFQAERGSILDDQ